MSAFGPQRSWYHKLDGYGRPMRPTIEPTPGFSASADAERLHRAVKGAGTDEQTIIDILAHRTNHERQQICAAYQNQYKQSLRQDLKDDTSGDFRTVLCELVHDMPYLLAKALYYAMKGHGTNERVLIEVMVTLWNDEMKAVAEAYKQVLKDEKIDETMSAIPMDNVHFLFLLHSYPGRQLGTTEQRISRVLCGRTTFQVAADAEAYEKATGTSLLDAMEKELTGDYRKLIKALSKTVLENI
ncbi:unnamed protein product [Dicrocoelium dendriticum]|nr:unnamed protein product [Dicrocoelium dendriticum]